MVWLNLNSNLKAFSGRKYLISVLEKSMPIPGEKMILLYLIVLIVALVIANILVALARPKRRNPSWKNENAVVSDNAPLEPEIITALSSIDEKHSLVQGSVQAINQKMNILSDRVSNLESAVTGIIESKVGSDHKQAEQEVDYEKVDFRVKVLEQKIDSLETKIPRAPVQKSNTFYGKLNDDMEKEIKSLAFNTKKTSQKTETTN